jgi:hypothetical protein
VEVIPELKSSALLGPQDLGCDLDVLRVDRLACAGDRAALVKRPLGFDCAQQCAVAAEFGTVLVG